MALALALAVLMPIATCLSADETATITVTDEIARRNLSPEAFCGVNWEHSGYLHTMREIWNRCYREFIDFLQANGIRTFRYPGGGYVTRFYPGAPSRAWFEQFKATTKGPHRQEDWIEYEEFLQFLADGDFHGIIQLNTFSAFDKQANKTRQILSDDGELQPEVLELAAKAAAWAVRYAKRRGLDRYVSCWEIGNEEYFTYTAEQYGQIVGAFIQAIRRVDPDIHILVTTQWSFPNAGPEKQRIAWSAGVLQTLCEDLSDRRNITFVNHEYAWVMEDPEHSAYDEWQRYVGTNPTHRYEQPWGELPCAPYELLFRVYDANGFENADVYVTEFRYGWMTNLYNKSLASGVANVNLIMHYIKHPRIRGCVFHSLLHGSHVTEEGERPFGYWGFNMIEYAPTPTVPHNFISTPISQGYRLIEAFCHGDLLKAESSTWNLNVAAARDRDTIRLLVVNRTRESEEAAETNTISADIVLPRGWRPTSAVAHVLDSESLGDRSATLSTYDQVHEILVRRHELALPEEGGLRVSFPPHSATLVELSR